MERLALEGIAGFAANIANPFLLLLVVVAAFACRRNTMVRLVAAGIGCLFGLVELLVAQQAHHILVVLASATLAGLLLGELMLQVVLPAIRLAMRIFMHALSILQRVVKAIVE